MKTDPAIEVVRAVRLAISHHFAHDPARLIAYYMDLQSRYQGGSLIEGPEQAPASTSSRPPPASSNQLRITAVEAPLSRRAGNHH
jgi:hypothetical protein